MKSIKKARTSYTNEQNYEVSPQKGIKQSDMDKIIQGIKNKYSREAITQMSQEELQNEVMQEID